jgi:hypothetical protein
MRRIDLPEIEDQPGFPAPLRDAMTGFLRVVLGVTNPYSVAAPALAELLRDQPSRRVLDLASGGGGPWPDLIEALAREGIAAEVALSDLHPNLEAGRRLEAIAGLSYRREPLSALAVPPTGGAVRTLFTGLHHFGPAQVQAILRGAQEAGVSFLAAEASHRSLRGLLLTLFIPLLVLALMPRVQPRRLLPLVLTYLAPVLPALIWWDGFASTLKSYRAAELEALIDEIREPGYDWRIEEVRIPRAPVPVTLVVGRPAARTA